MSDSHAAASDCTNPGVGDAVHVASALADIAERGRRNPMPLYHVAEAHRRSGDVRSWRRAIELALECPHLTHEQRFHRALAKLTLGDWSGWSDYEARHFGPSSAMQHKKHAREIRWTRKAWDGVEDISNKRLLVLHEGRDSEAIQMLRFIPSLVSKAKRVILETPIRLVPLIQHNFKGLVEIAIDGLDLPIAYDRYVWLMTLPAMFSDSIPMQRLVAPGRKPRRVHSERSTRAGICWSRETAGQVVDDNQISPATLAPVLTRVDVEWHSLRLGDPVTDTVEFAAPVAAEPALFTFADMADVIANMDCIVTVDTAVCDLAGSLGVPTYLLLPTAASWRWGLNDTTPWYPDVHIIRQQVAGDWASVVATLNARLDGYSAREDVS